MKNDFGGWVRALQMGVLVMGFFGPATAADPGRGVGAPGPGAAGVGAPGAGARDPGLNQPGAAGNVGGAGKPGVGADPGLNQPGVAGNVSGVARQSVRR